MRALFESHRRWVPAVLVLVACRVEHESRYGVGGTMSVDVPAAGMSLGYRWQRWDRYALFPEVGWTVSPTGFNGFDRMVTTHAGIALVRAMGQ